MSQRPINDEEKAEVRRLQEQIATEPDVRVEEKNAWLAVERFNAATREILDERKRQHAELHERATTLRNRLGKIAAAKKQLDCIRAVYPDA